MKTKYISWTVAGILALFWFVYVWPTPWSYFKTEQDNVRVNRFTGETQVLRAGGWAELR